MYVYLVATIEEFPKFKIGRSKNPESRIKQLQTASGSPLELLKKYESKYPTVLEKNLHKHFNGCNYINEWFGLSKKDVDEFEQICDRFEQMYRSMEHNPFWCKSHGIKYIGPEL